MKLFRQQHDKLGSGSIQSKKKEASLDALWLVSYIGSIMKPAIKIRLARALLYAGLFAIIGWANIGRSQNPQFVDVTVPSGLTYLQEGPCVVPGYLCGPTVMTGGVAVGDYDNDGWPDVFVTRVQLAPILFRNRGDGTFENKTVAAGLNLPSTTNAAGFADVDNDGDLDLYVTTVGGDHFFLFINNGGVFTEDAIARGAGVQSANPMRMGWGVSFGDYDLDGALDIHTTEWGTPTVLEPHTRLLRNQGGGNIGYFDDVTQIVGLAMPTIFGFTSAFVDLDGDNWPDLPVSGDFGTSRIFWNNGDGTFQDGTLMAGPISDENGMGSTFGDYDGDGRLDWFVTSIFDTNGTYGNKNGNRLYRNEGGRMFTDRTDEANVRHGFWGWGTAFMDYDNDGDLDLTMTNGFFPPGEGDTYTQFHYDPVRFWRNNGQGKYTEIAQSIGLTDSGSGKGLATLDYDRDGDLDLLIINNVSGAILYRNDGGNSAGWLKVKVTGSSSNRDGYGAKITVRTSKKGPGQVREVGANTHYLGQSELTAHFGLGKGTTKVAEVRVFWPKSGQTQIFRNVARNTTLVAVEPAP